MSKAVVPCHVQRLVGATKEAMVSKTGCSLLRREETSNAAQMKGLCMSP